MNKYINGIIKLLILLLFALAGYCIFIYFFFYLNILGFKISEEGKYYFVFAIIIIPLMLTSVIFFFITIYLITKKQFKEIKFIYYIAYHLFIGFSYLPILGGMAIYLSSSKHTFGSNIFEYILSITFLIIVFFIIPLIIPLSVFVLINILKKYE